MLRADNAARSGTVACCVADADALARVRATLRRDGLAVIELRSAALTVEPASEWHGPARGLPQFDLLVYDLSPWDDSAVHLVRAFRSNRPRTPLLVYHPPGDLATTLAARIATLPGITVQVQQPAFPGEELRVRRLVRELLTGIPTQIAAWLAREVLGPAPPLTHRFANTALRQLARGGLTTPRVEEVARELGVRRRDVQRACHATGLPSPKRLLQWLTLLHVSVATEWTGKPLVRMARRVGLSQRDLHRWRRDLLAEEVSSARDATLEIVFLAFAQACGVARTRAGEVLRRAG